MYVLALLLLIVSLSKLLLAMSSNKMEMKELVYNSPVFVNIPPGTLSAIITLDGLLGLMCSLFLLGAL